MLFKFIMDSELKKEIESIIDEKLTKIIRGIIEPDFDKGYQNGLTKVLKKHIELSDEKKLKIEKIILDKEEENLLKEIQKIKKYFI